MEDYIFFEKYLKYYNNYVVKCGLTEGSCMGPLLFFYYFLFSDLVNYLIQSSMVKLYKLKKRCFVLLLIIMHKYYNNGKIN